MDKIEKHDEFYFFPSARLAICLSRQITSDLVSQILAVKPTNVILLDVGFNHDNKLKTNILFQIKNAGVAVEVV
jgi:hypothetical protein